MDALQAIVLGIVQGLTEFLPVSSTAHLRIVPAFFGWDDPGAAFTAVVQLGTLAAVLVYFRRDLWSIASAWVRSALARERAPEDPEARLGWYIILGTIPIAILGLAFKNQIEDQFRTLELVGSALVLFSLVMLRAEAVSRRDRELGEITTPRRADHRLRAGPRARAGRLALGRDHLRRPVPELRSHRGRALLVPAVGAGRRAVRALRAAPRRRRRRRARRVRPRSPPCWPSSSGTRRSPSLLRYLVHHSIGIFAAYRMALGLIVIVLASTNVIS